MDFQKQICQALWQGLARLVILHQASQGPIYGGRLSQGPGDGRIPLTYHDPCHLKKSLGVAAQPRVLVQANPGYVLTEMPEAVPGR